MVDINRRLTLIAGLSLISGCLTGTDADNRLTPTRSETRVPAVDVRNPETTLTYGASFVNVGLRITVETPTIESSFRVKPEDGSNQRTPTPATNTASNETETSTASSRSDDGGRLIRLPDGRAVVFAPIRLSNEHSDREIRIAAPNFVLVTSEDVIVEIQNVGLPESDRAVRPRDIERFSDPFNRWTMQGTAIEPGETVRTIALFDASSDLALDEFDIAFDPYLNGVGNEYYEPRTAAWTKSTTDGPDRGT